MIVNLTPHTINLFNADKEHVMDVAPSGTIARVATSRAMVGEAAGVPLFRTDYGALDGLPAPQPDTIYVVSGLVRAACQRPDLYQPGELIRNEAGQPIGCVGLSQ